MKVLLINGSPHEHGCTDAALREVAKTLEGNGIGTETFRVDKKPVAGCIACAKCKTAGKCVFGDAVNDILSRVGEYDGLVIGSPVYYASAPGQLIAFLDRLFYASAGRWANKPAACVVSCRRAGATATFDEINKYFTISDMPIVSSDYWNNVHGANNAPEDVARDEEGLQTMRHLAVNMAWMLRCIEAGKAAGVPMPAHEDKILTNFIHR